MQILQIMDPQSTSTNLNGVMHKLEHCLCTLLAGVSLALPLESKVISTVVAPQYISLTAKD